MPALPIDTRRTSTSRGTFNPNGRLMVIGARPNPITWSKNTLAARFLVGFNVEGVPTWNIDDLIQVVHDHRIAHGAPADATFFYTKGMWSGKGIPETEEGAQVLLIAPKNTALDAFLVEMERLGEAIRAALKQWKVILEIQENGVTTMHADIDL